MTDDVNYMYLYYGHKLDVFKKTHLQEHCKDIFKLVLMYMFSCNDKLSFSK